MTMEDFNLFDFDENKIFMHINALEPQETIEYLKRVLVNLEALLSNIQNLEGKYYYNTENHIIIKYEKESEEELEELGFQKEPVEISDYDIRIEMYEESSYKLADERFIKKFYLPKLSLKDKLTTLILYKEKELSNSTSLLASNYSNITPIQITGRYGKVDIVRIFEAMKEANIISNNTQVNQIANLFFKEVADLKKHEDNYNATKNQIKQHNRTSNSKDLLNFIKNICGISFKKKPDEIHELITFLDKIEH